MTLPVRLKCGDMVLISHAGLSNVHSIYCTSIQCIVATPWSKAEPYRVARRRLIVDTPWPLATLEWTGATPAVKLGLAKGSVRLEDVYSSVKILI